MDGSRDPRHPMSIPRPAFRPLVIAPASRASLHFSPCAASARSRGSTSCPSSWPCSSAGTSTRSSTSPACGTPARPAGRWLLPAGLVYLVAYTVWGLYYVILLNDQGAHAPAATGLRAYFISQMGKYVPGKILVIVIRVGMLRGIGITRTAVGHHGHVREPGLGRGRGDGRDRPLARRALAGAPGPGAAEGNALPDIHRAWLILPVVLAPIGLVGLNRFVNRVNRWRRGPDARQLPAGQAAHGRVRADVRRRRLVGPRRVPDARRWSASSRTPR